MIATTVRRDTGSTAAATAVVGTLLLLVLARIALGSRRGQSWDESAMRAVTGGRDTQLTVLSLLGYVGIGAVVAVVVGCVAVAVLRGRLALAAGAVAVIAGSNVTTQVLKHFLLDRPDLGLGTLNSLPSGHTTVVASAVGAALLVAPSGWRLPIALAGGFATTLTGASTVVAGWHRPSDVLAALAVSLIWTAGVAVVLRGRQAPAAGTAVVALLGCVGATLFLVAIGVRPLLGWDGFAQSAIVLSVIAAATAAFVTATATVSPTD